MPYTTLNDAAAITNDQGYAKGSTRIWYARPDKQRDLIMGHEFCFKHGYLPSKAAIEKTHILLGSITAKELETVFDMMQGERWSPHGEARALIQSSGLRHTSMSIGDIIQVGNDYLFVDRSGFVLLDS